MARPLARATLANVDSACRGGAHKGAYRHNTRRSYHPSDSGTRPPTGATMPTAKEVTHRQGDRQQYAAPLPAQQWRPLDEGRRGS
ncbi:hypothetical protein BHE74_00059328 [Ensete ventricosum]|nr:hypothetical protein BHE74_00059328 [Ensete ventricosum]